MKYLPRRRSLYPPQENTQQAKSIPRMNIVLMYEKYKITKKSAGNGTKLKKKIRIRNKHPGSETLGTTVPVSKLYFENFTSG